MENTEFISEITEGNLKPGVIEAFLDELPSKALNFGVKVLLCVLLFLIGVKIIQFIRKMLQNPWKRRGRRRGSAPLWILL